METYNNIKLNRIKPFKKDTLWKKYLNSECKLLYHSIINELAQLPSDKKNLIPNISGIDSSNITPFTLVNPTDSSDSTKPCAVLIHYFAADNDLSGSALVDIKEILAANKDNKITLLALVDFADNNGFFVLEIDQSNDIKLVEHWKVDQNNHLDAVQLFMAKGLYTHSNAGKVALGLWGHSNQIYYQNSSNNVSFRDLYIFPDDNADRQGSQGLISLEELQSGFEWIFQTSQRGNNKVNLIYLDTCLLQTIEINSVLQPFTKTVVASQNLIPNNGIDYTGWLNLIKNTIDTIDDKELSSNAVISYADFYSQGPPGNHWTLSALNTNEISKVADSFKIWVDTILNLDENPLLKELKYLKKAFRKTIKFPWEEYEHLSEEFECTIDLYSFLSHYKDLTKDTDLIQKTVAVLTEIDQIIYQSKVESSIDGATSRMGANGICIWFPKKNKYNSSLIAKIDDETQSFYPQIPFVKNTGWIKLCKKYLNS